MEDSKEKLEQEIAVAGKHYSEEKFWKKLARFGKKAGSSVVYAVLLLYYTLQKPSVPKKIKVTIIGALGYFILPIDLIPDFLVGIGYTDDLGALGIALFQVAMYIDDDIKTKAKAKLAEWFGSKVDTAEIDKKLNKEIH
ncbi:YkvA family protein [Niallia sp.]|uniref:YkvA family protein n=1 Tax=Niallia sp. TaxID=2837523 RepID=UPI0028988263|nr:YkvA family protein [Niallia sp.]